MNRKNFLALLLTAALIVLGAAVYAGGGAADDPLVTLSYLQDIFTKPIEEKLAASCGKLLDGSLSKLDSSAYSASLGQKMDQAFAAALEQRVAKRVSEKLTAQNNQILRVSMTELTLKKGDRLTGTPGARFIVKSGTGAICGSAGATVLNVTAGGLRTPGSDIKAGICYMMLADDGSGLLVTSPTASVLVKDGCRVATQYAVQYTAYADALKTLGLFMGSNKGYELERAPTRQEALIMLIRLLGEEKDALAYTEPSTFGDVSGWLDGRKYIAYGEYKQYTNGNGKMPNGKIKFSQAEPSSLDMYLTFVLRSLGYDDKAGDFVWNTTSRTLAVKLGLLTDSDVLSIQKTGLMRDHVAYISYHALWAKLKNSTNTLGDKLVSTRTVTRDALNAAAGLK